MFLIYLFNGLIGINESLSSEMSVPTHVETRRFTRGLSKPGTAAELRQSVSEAVRTSVLVVSMVCLYCGVVVKSCKWYQEVVGSNISHRRAQRIS